MKKFQAVIKAMFMSRGATVHVVRYVNGEYDAVVDMPFKIVERYKNGRKIR